ncbi:DUF3566 domain-containing protein [Blastococcus haudaquaticus]|uniref:DUF3566 domain-containing protein n=1 Tax=Blastococcus haudaquaticus TaxID=1938745 RepID=A0A286GJ91_9ACTN|nr:DUF3566 domain-containing protein [Blastococcus haudaquaticus]SOD95588.1 Transmembrane protein of unknown function [Blastococcus haudaquaticus]
MSDRTQGSVRTESAAVTDGSTGAGPSTGSTAVGAPPVTATQTIPTTGSQKAQVPTAGPATGSTPAVGQPVGAPPVGAPSVGAPSEDTAAAGRAPKGRVPGRGGRGPRRARLQLRHIDTWSALKISLVLSIAMFFIWMVAVGILYGVLNALGVFDTLNDLFGQIGSASGDEATGDAVTPGLVFGGAAIIGAINIVLMTALCTVGTFIYNLCSDLVGGLELTLSERD